MLDGEGKIGAPSRLEQFVVFMTRVEKIEHRSLCMQVIASKLTDQCRADFSGMGGMRVLKNWIESAVQEESVFELTTLVKVCLRLPFNEKVIREVGIAKTLKRLLKYEGAAEAAAESSSGLSVGVADMGMGIGIGIPDMGISLPKAPVARKRPIDMKAGARLLLAERAAAAEGETTPRAAAQRAVPPRYHCSCTRRSPCCSYHCPVRGPQKWSPVPRFPGPRFPSDARLLGGGGPP
ncbi:hypothetical protein B484DRAFT_483898 [Ochromonadaceae sp. CCMP2298]|nr:hypothetical protein B484DRAFT_483898 [Ochromonadaceae sp. CCMP2298]